VGTEARPDQPPDLLLLDPPPADQHPAELYLAERAPRSRDRTREALDIIAALLTEGRGRAGTVDWGRLTGAHIEALRAALAQRYPPAAGRRMLGVLRGLLEVCARKGLMPAAEYREAREAALRAGPGSRGELRSLLASCADDDTETTRPHGAVRTLLYGNGARQGNAMVRMPDPALPARMAGSRMTSLVRLHLRRAARQEAIAHALWEAGACLRVSAFCGCLAMLAKALDLWTMDYDARRRPAGGPPDGDPGDLARRLVRIAHENEAHRELIQAIAESLSHEAADAHSGLVCRGGHVNGFDAYAVARVKETYRNLHEAVVTLITATTPDLPL
jgi:hypothetical protein